MARFPDNPTKDPLDGSEIIPGTDTGTGDDIKFTPQVLANYVVNLLPIATGAQRGVVSGPNGDKLAALYSKAQIDALLAQLAQTLLPIFFGTAANGSVQLLVNNTANAIVLNAAAFACSVGSAVAAITIDGTPVTGLTGMAVSATPGTAAASAANTLGVGQVLGITFTGSSGSPGPENVRITLKGTVVLI